MVAVLWQQLFAFAADVTLTVSDRVSLGLAVWIIYVSDRVADSSRPILPTARHVFYRGHRRPALAAIAMALVAEVVVCYRLPSGVFDGGLLVVTIVCLYFARIHIARRIRPLGLPKEVIVAATFAAGTALTSISRFSFSSLLVPSFLFATLCLLNCSTIEYRERQYFTPIIACVQHGATHWLAKNLQWIGVMVAIIASIGTSIAQDRQLYAGLAISAISLAFFDRIQTIFSADQMRVIADLPLVLPGLLLLINFVHGL